MSEYYNISKEYLNEQYVIKKRPARDIAKDFGCSHGLILHKLKEFEIPRRKQNNPVKDLSKLKFGKLTVLNKHLNHHQNSKTKWKCLCDCGKESIVTYAHLINNETLACKICRTKNKKFPTKGKNNHKWTGYEEINGAYWCSIKTGASQRNIEFFITIEDIWNQFIKQNRRCNLSGRILQFSKNSRTQKDGTASLDRIDSKKGYTIDNIQWIHKDINKMKMNFEEKYFINTCKEITEYKK